MGTGYPPAPVQAGRGGAGHSIKDSSKVKKVNVPMEQPEIEVPVMLVSRRQEDQLFGFVELSTNVLIEPDVLRYHCLIVEKSAQCC